MAIDNPNESSAPGNGTKKPSQRTTTVPKKDKDLSTVSGNAAKSWIADPEITLKWKKAADFKIETDAFTAQLVAREDAGENRPEMTARLKVLDAAIDKGTKYIKGYLDEDFENQAQAQYAKYGIEKTSKGYYLPTDRNKRVPALTRLLKGIKDGGYDARKFGKAYFEPIVTEYQTLFTQAGTSDSSVSSKVGDKNVQRKEIEKTLKALIYVLKANYPDTSKNVLRAWGFQKEKY